MEAITIGVVYRSPNTTKLNNDRLIEMVKTANRVKKQHLLICGDFNFPSIDWALNFCEDNENTRAYRFWTVMNELSLIQHVTTPTRFRGNQQSCLDLIFSNEQEMVSEIIEMEPIGKSDNICKK